MWLVDYSLAVIGFGAGVAFVLLINKLQNLHFKNQKAGEEEVCCKCDFKEAVLSFMSNYEED